MIPKLLTEYLEWAVRKRYPALLTGKPGRAKTDIAIGVAKSLSMDLLFWHPIVFDPTDVKGLPFPANDGKTAEFLHYGDLVRLLEAKQPLICFLDNLGQATASVQAACMQLILSRRINDHKISDHVTFLGA